MFKRFFSFLGGCCVVICVGILCFVACAAMVKAIFTVTEESKPVPIAKGYCTRINNIEVKCKTKWHDPDGTALKDCSVPWQISPVTLRSVTNFYECAD